MKRRNFLQSITYCSLGTGMVSAIPVSIFGRQPSELPVTSKIQSFNYGRDWFFERRFGMFVHWGLYSIPGWHEQHQYRARVARSEYVKLLKQWNPTKFDPEKWLDLLEEGGMKYLCFTAKHCDGFSLWDTRQTPFNVMNTPYKKDIIGILSDACHKRKIPLCLYYSIVDWNNPIYPNQGRAHELQPQPHDTPNQEKYLEFVKKQVNELCTNYGEIHGFWWDANRLSVKDPSFNALIRQLQPKAVINNRGFDEGDFSTPERDFEKDDKLSFDKAVEACQAVGMESWGYKKDEDFFTDRHLISSIDRYMARNANYLLNVGPTSEGIIPNEAAAILRRIGKWKKSVDESFQKVQPDTELINSPGVLVTRRDRTLYIHLNQFPVGNGLKLKPINVMPSKATLLNTGEAIDCVVNLCPSDHASQQPYLRLRNLPVNEMANTVLIVKLEFDRPLDKIRQLTNSAVNNELIK